jgi:hypothetical protein
MRDADRYKLLGTYRTPRVRVGPVLTCEARDGDVVVTGYSDARIPWPLGRVRGGRGQGGLVVYGALAEAVRRDSNQAVAHWFGVKPNTLSLWRKALEVRRTNEGTGRLRRAYGAEDWFAGVRAKGQSARWTDDRRAEMSAKLKGRTYGPEALANIRAGHQRKTYTKHTPEAKTKMRAAAAARLARGQVPNGRAWTPGEDDLVRTLPAPAAAGQTGRPITHVYKRRRKLKVPDGRRDRSGCPSRTEGRPQSGCHRLGSLRAGATPGWACLAALTSSPSAPESSGGAPCGCGATSPACPCRASRTAATGGAARCKPASAPRPA